MAATTCQMCCGACKNPATLSLNVGGRLMDAINMASLTLRKYRAPKRTLHACEKHRKNLESCGDLYGRRGHVQEVR